MPPELHLHPDRLLAHGTAAAGLAEELHAALRGAPVDAGPSDDQERLLGVVGMAISELAELGATLRAAADSATTAEAEVGAGLTRVREALGQEQA